MILFYYKKESVNITIKYNVKILIQFVQIIFL